MEAAIGWMCFLTALAIVLFVYSGCAFSEQHVKSRFGVIICGLLFLAGAFIIAYFAFREYGAGQIARDVELTALKVNTPYAVKKSVAVPIIGGSVYLVFLCNVYSEGSAAACDSDPTKWLAYQFPRLPPPYFLKLKNGTYKEISLEDAKLLLETARQ